VATAGLTLVSRPQGSVALVSITIVAARRAPTIEAANSLFHIGLSFLSYYPPFVLLDIPGVN
jgi:hypothetical protein